MYRRPTGQMVIEDFVLPFEGKLNANNRWVKLAKIIPWEQIEKDYAELFPSHLGTVAKPLRMALGKLLIMDLEHRLRLLYCHFLRTIWEAFLGRYCPEYSVV